MLGVTEVRATVLAEIKALLLEEDEEIDGVQGSAQLHDIALDSLLLARLVIQLEKVVRWRPLRRGRGRHRGPPHRRRPHRRVRRVAAVPAGAGAKA